MKYNGCADSEVLAEYFKRYNYDPNRREEILKKYDLLFDKYIDTTKYSPEEQITILKNLNKRSWRNNMKIYLAGSIFYHGDVLRNTEWAAKIRAAIPSVDLYSPIENTEINGTEGKKKFAGSQEIANGDNIRLNNTDILVACIDGDILPAGTCAEIGKFHEKIERGDHKYIVGICTDNRQMYLTHSEAKNIGGAAALGEQQYSYQNLYVTGLIKQGGILVSNIEDAIAFIKEKENEF